MPRSEEAQPPAVDQNAAGFICDGSHWGAGRYLQTNQNFLPALTGRENFMQKTSFCKPLVH